jgi:hypothetical protein
MPCLARQPGREQPLTTMLAPAMPEPTPTPVQPYGVLPAFCTTTV